MKRSTRSNKNSKIVVDYLTKHPLSSAAEIAKGTGLKGNIYTTLMSLIEKKLIGKNDAKQYYQLLDSKNSVSPRREIKNNLDISKDLRMPLFQARDSNSLTNIYRKEISHIQSGIDQLVITKNYLERRVEEMENAK